MQMTCPKCHGDMRVYERSGVTIDQCTECRGIFLDRGELEKLFAAEATWNGRQAPGPQQGGHAPQPSGYPAAPPSGGYPPPPPPPPHQPGYPSHQPGYPPATHGYPPAPAYGSHGGQHGYHGHYRQKKHKSFLNELFD